MYVICSMLTKKQKNLLLFIKVIAILSFDNIDKYLASEAPEKPPPTIATEPIFFFIPEVKSFLFEGNEPQLDKKTLPIKAPESLKKYLRWFICLGRYCWAKYFAMRRISSSE